MSSSSSLFWKPKPLSHQVLIESDNHFNNDNHYSGFPPPSSSLGSLAQQRMLLPIYKHKKQILYAVQEYPVVILVGETGCGKSTQLPQYLWQDGGWSNDVNLSPPPATANVAPSSSSVAHFQIACTQPRRMAAHHLAVRVAHEVAPASNIVAGPQHVGTPLVEMARIRYLTDAMLVREATMVDPLLSKYSCIILDEAHERTLHTDILLGLLKRLLQSRRAQTLRLVVCSATIDAQAFVDFFCNNNKNDSASSIRATIISVDGRLHPIDVLYLKQPTSDYIRETVQTAMKIIDDDNDEHDDGDILAFLPSSQDVEQAMRMANEMMDHAHLEYNRQQSRSNKKSNAPPPQVNFLPLYGTLPAKMQARVFQDKSMDDNEDRNNKRSSSLPNSKKRKHSSFRRRRVIFATNIAETSVTVPYIGYVVDCGFCKLPHFDPQTGLDYFITSPISQASAQQRAGRAGRVQSGQCFRLYTQNYFFDKMSSATRPEMCRTNVTSLVLILKFLGVDNILLFDLMDMPSIDAISHALETLYVLGAIDDETQLTTPLGWNMATFPTEPRISRMILHAIEYDNEHHDDSSSSFLQGSLTWSILNVASVLQQSSSSGLLVWPRTLAQRTQYEAALKENLSAGLLDRSGDHVTYANIMAEMDQVDWNREECRERYLHYIAIQRARQIRSQLIGFIKQRRRHLLSRSRRRDEKDDIMQQQHLVLGQDLALQSRLIRECVTAGFFFHVAKLQHDGHYYTLRGNHLVSPVAQCIFQTHGISSEYIVFGETTTTSNSDSADRGTIQVCHVSAIEAQWLRQVAPHYWE